MIPNLIAGLTGLPKPPDPLSGGTLCLSISSSGAATFAGSVTATGFFESSDERLKNIAIAYQSDNFGALEFTWKDGRDSKNHWGYSAQAVQKWLPDAVQENNDGYLTVDYNQAHTFKIQKLEEEINRLFRSNAFNISQRM
jgi:hypothetical protein